MDWFRFYSEAMGDVKIKRLSRQLKRSTAEVLGAWTIILSFASSSPDRGRLLIGEGIPITEDDIADAAGVDVTEIIRGFESLSMIERDGDVWRVTHWDERQFVSDDSAPRMRRLREARKKSDSDDVASLSRHNVVTVTPEGSNGDAVVALSDTDTDTESESEKDVQTGPASQGAIAPSTVSLAEQFLTLKRKLESAKGNERPPILLDVYRLCFGEQGEMPAYGYLGKIAKEVGGAGRLADLMWQLTTRPPTGDVLSYILKSHKGGGVNGNGHASGNRPIRNSLEVPEAERRKEPTDDEKLEIEAIRKWKREHKRPSTVDGAQGAQVPGVQ